MPELPHNLAGEVLRAFLDSGYVYAIAACQILGGLLLIIGRFVPLGLTILGPVIVNLSKTFAAHKPYRDNPN